MDESTRELLNAHQASILRELNDIKGGVIDIGQRTNVLEKNMAVLSWAYGLGTLIFGAVAAKLGFGGGGQ